MPVSDADLPDVVVHEAFWQRHGSEPLTALLAFGILAAGSFAVHPQGSDWRFVALSAVTLALSGVLIRVVPIRADSAWLAVVPAASAILAIALLRQSQGGSTSGYGPLAIIPLVWVAVVLDVRAVQLVTACICLMFALPLWLLGDPLYPSSGWRGAVLWTVVVFLVGMLVHAIVSEHRRAAIEANRHAAQIEEMQLAFAVISRVSRDVALGTDARGLVCAAAVATTDARLATIVEPRGDGFSITGSAGVPLDEREIEAVRPAESLVAFASGERVFVADVAQRAGVAPVIVEATGIVSIVFEPILRNGRPVGVLCVAWDVPRSDLDGTSGAIIQFLASEAGAAIERSDLLRRLDSQARSDQLTELSNRRAWDEALALAMHHTTPLSVAMIDLDYFKAYNDLYGHAAGDELLRECARAWKAHLRPTDTLARYGGEEFAAILLDCSLADASIVLERLRRATPAKATASIGVVERRPGEGADDVLARADVALYQAKAGGRDRLRAA